MRRETPEQLTTYADMLRDVPNPWCWACGRGPTDRPAWWNAPWLIVRAHIAKSPRVRDRRVVVLLCPACHGRVHGERYAAEPDVPRLALRHLVWLKLKLDPGYYDRDFLRAHLVGSLPRAVPPDAYYPQSYCNRHRPWSRIPAPRRVPRSADV